MRRLVVIFLVLVVVWLGASFAVAWKRTSRSDPITAEPPPPASLGSVDSFRLRTSDGEELGAWYIPGRADKPGVVLLHGNRAHRGAMCNIAQILHDAGYALLIPTLRAHGDSTGERNDFGYSARHDVVAAVDELQRRRPESRVIVFGQSMGAAAALFAADELQHHVDGYVLECPYEHLFKAVRNRTRAELPMGLDWIAYAGLRTVSPT
ncbi:MAG: alpha/beta hydrolase [Gemmataceae bacterium]